MIVYIKSFIRKLLFIKMIKRQCKLWSTPSFTKKYQSQVLQLLTKLVFHLGDAVRACGNLIIPVWTKDKDETGLRWKQ